MSNEEPLSSLKVPFKRVDAGVYYESGDLASVGSAIIMRLIDSNNTEAILAIVRDTSSREYSRVIANPDIKWTDDPIFRFDTDMAIPSEFYNTESKGFIRLNNDSVAVNDLRKILKRHRKDNHELEIALDALNGKYNQ